MLVDTDIYNQTILLDILLDQQQSMRIRSVHILEIEYSGRECCPMQNIGIPNVKLYFVCKGDFSEKGTKTTLKI